MNIRITLLLLLSIVTQEANALNDLPVKDTDALDINNNNVIVGSRWVEGEGYSPFIYAGGVFSYYKIQGRISNGDFNNMCINDSGQIVGSYSDIGKSPKYHGFSYENGVAITIDYPGSDSTFLICNNNNGLIVGYYTINGVMTWFTYDGAFAPISVKGKKIIQIGGINDSNVIVGTYESGKTGKIFTYKNGKLLKSINASSALIDSGVAINNKGAIAAATEKGVCLYTKTSCKEAIIASASANSFSVVAINDSNQIVGGYLYDTPSGNEYTRIFSYKDGNYVPYSSQINYGIGVTGLNNSGVFTGWRETRNYTIGFTGP